MRRLALIFWLFDFGWSIAAHASEPVGFWGKLQGVDVNDYRQDFLQQVEKELSQLTAYGKCKETILRCLNQDKPSPVVTRLARGVLLKMAAGLDHQQLLEWLEKRRQSAYPQELYYFKLEGLEPLGEKTAPVVLVDFADFQCPFCSRSAQIIEKLYQRFGNKLAVYFKQFPIKGKPFSIQAAKACVAAGRLGKFWPYCLALFQNQKNFSEEFFGQLAEKFDLEREAFEKEMSSEQVLDRVADDKMEGLRARIEALPAIFINGKKYLLDLDLEDLADRIEEELDIVGGRD